MSDTMDLAGIMHCATKGFVCTRDYPGLGPIDGSQYAEGVVGCPID
jgi:hypothetical protein